MHRNDKGDEKVCAANLNSYCLVSSARGLKEQYDARVNSPVLLRLPTGRAAVSILWHFACCSGTALAVSQKRCSSSFRPPHAGNRPWNLRVSRSTARSGLNADLADGWLTNTTVSSLQKHTRDRELCFHGEIYEDRASRATHPCIRDASESVTPKVTDIYKFFWKNILFMLD